VSEVEVKQDGELLSEAFRDLINHSNERMKESLTFPSVGTVQGNGILLSGFERPIPTSEFSVLSHWDHTTGMWKRPNISSGDQVLLVPIGDSDYVIVGRLG